LADRKVVLASIATGAAIAIRYARYHQERVLGQVMHLPFLGKAAIGKKWLRPVVAYALWVPPLRALVDRLRAIDALMHRIILHEPPDAIPELAERDIRHKQHADLNAAGQLLHSLMLTDSVAEMASLRQPTLILASEHDFTAPLRLLERVVRNRPERRLYVHRGGQHSWNEPFIEQMNKEIRAFLTGLAPILPEPVPDSSAKSRGPVPAPAGEE
jgi:pimeloyl-ACP methyl ester carboxylesterase